MSVADMTPPAAPCPKRIPDPEVQPVLWVDEVATVLRVSPSTVYAAIAADEIPHVRLRGRIVIPTAALRRMLGLDVEASAP